MSVPEAVGRPFELQDLILAVVGVFTLLFCYLRLRNHTCPNTREHRARPAALRPEYTLKPFAERMENAAVNPQSRCPLFSILPSEVRALIWEAALRRYPDPTSSYAKIMRCYRPGQTGVLRIDTHLLSTCRAVYLEAYQLAVTVNPLLDFQGHHADIPPGVSHGAETVHGFPLWQFCAVQSYDVTMQQVFLEGSGLGAKAFMLRADEANAEEILKDMRRYWRPSDSFTWPTIKPEDTLTEAGAINVSKRLTHLTIRLNRTDWWTWAESPDSQDQLGLDPSIGTGSIDDRCTREHMVGAADLRRRGTWPGYNQRHCWGKDVGLFKNLRTFEIVMETFAAKKIQLELVVECAKTWTFPRDAKHELRFESVTSDNWVGVSGYDYEREAPWLARESISTQHGGPESRKFENPHHFEVRIVRYSLQRKYKD